MGTSDTLQRKLPPIPTESHPSKASRFWATVRRKLLDPVGLCSPRPLISYGRSQSQPDNGTRPYHRTISLDSYNTLVENHSSMVLPGLRHRPPPPLPEAQMQIASLSNGTIDNRNSQYFGVQLVEDEKNTRRLSESIRNSNRPTCLSASVKSILHQGWYWGPLDRLECESKLRELPNGSFLVRDSTDDRHLYTLSFRQNDRILHVRIEFIYGLFTFFTTHEKAVTHGKPSVEELINSSCNGGIDGEFGSKDRQQVNVRVDGIRIFLKHPVSRFDHVRSLQHLCKFVLRANMNKQKVLDLPLPVHIKTWVAEQDFL